MQTLKHSVVLTQIFAFLDGREKVRTQVLCRYCYCTVAPLLLASVPCEPEITLIEGFTLYRTFPHSLRNRERWETVCKKLPRALMSNRQYYFYNVHLPYFYRFGEEVDEYGMIKRTFFRNRFLNVLDTRTMGVELVHHFNQVMDKGMLVRDRHLLYVQYFYTLDELTYIYEVDSQLFTARKS